MAEIDPGHPHVDVAGYLLGALSPEEAEAFRVHLKSCPACAHELEELRGWTGLLLPTPPPQSPMPPANLESRVFAALAGEPDRPSALPAPPRRSWQWPSWLRRPSWQAAAVAAVAALLILVLAVGEIARVLPPGRQPGPAPVPTQVVQLAAPAGGAARGTAHIQPSASGRVIELTVRDLPPPPAGHFYVCWLVADGDTLQHQDRIFVGSFVVHGTGPQTVRWETAADPARYPHLGVTLEPDDGIPLHRGPRVLSGTV
ncbi:MAG: anti-sigma factor [Candidatus Dormibacteraeota bacterium]|nr:anti-sigma factor [Candidatus Dormibacteraeota bacterium]